MLTEFKKYMEKEKLSDNSIQSYINDVSLFLKFFKEHFGEEIKKLNHIEIGEYKKELSKQNIAPSSINRKIASICKYNHYLVDKGIQSDIVITKRDYIKLQSNLVAPYSPTEKDIFKIKLCAKDSKRDLAIITLLSQTGIRESELTHIQLNDIDFNARTILIKGKGNKVRLVIITDSVYDTLIDYIDERKKKRNL